MDSVKQCSVANRKVEMKVRDELRKELYHDLETVSDFVEGIALLADVEVGEIPIVDLGLQEEGLVKCNLQVICKGLLEYLSKRLKILPIILSIQCLWGILEV